MNLRVELATSLKEEAAHGHLGTPCYILLGSMAIIGLSSEGTAVLATAHDYHLTGVCPMLLCRREIYIRSITLLISRRSLSLFCF